MKLNLQKNLKKLLKNKLIFYGIVFFTIMNIFNLVYACDIYGLLTFVLICYIVYYFTKNLGMTMLGGLLVSNFFKMGVMVKEGLENKEEEDEEDEEEGEKKTLPKVGKNKDVKKTLEDAYSGLEDIIGKDGMSNMSEDTKNVAVNQKDLLQQMNNMEPLIDKASSMIDKFDIDKFSGFMDKISGMTKR